MLACLIVPPFVKSTGGPFLGPSILKGAAESIGHRVRVHDLNNEWIRDHAGVGVPGSPSPDIAGDHDKPHELLRRLQSDFTRLLCSAGNIPWRLAGTNPYLTCTATFEEVYALALSLSRSEFGGWAERHLAEGERPNLVGVSVLYSGQVLAALAITLVARRLWPDVPVVWGGPHVTALREQIRLDARYGRWIDAFVFGYAEATFRDLCTAVDRGESWPVACVRAGSGSNAMGEQDRRVSPRFEPLEPYRLSRLTLPAQASRGCLFGKCGFCTYPAIEGAESIIPDEALANVVDAAVLHGAIVAFKDSLASGPTLDRIGRLIGGRVKWAACTKMTRALPDALPRFALAGLDTLEIGLETLIPESGRMIGKEQSSGLFHAVLEGAAAAGVGLVINYITGFPGEDSRRADEVLRRLRSEIAARREAGLRAVVEHNGFQLERLAPFASSPMIRVTDAWPWSSVLGWEAVGRRLEVIS